MTKEKQKEVVYIKSEQRHSHYLTKEKKLLIIPDLVTAVHQLQKEV